MQKIKEHLAPLKRFQFDLFKTNTVFSVFRIDIVRLYVSVNVNGYFMDSNIILLHLQNNCLVDQVVSPIPPGSLRAYLHGGGGPQIGEVTSGGHPNYHVNVIKLK